MGKLLDYIDEFHIVDKIKEIPNLLIFEIILIIFIFNTLFSLAYCQIYRYDKDSFKNIHNLESKEPIPFFDFLYFSHTTFYSLGYDIVPQSKLAKTLCMIHLKLGFIIMTIYIARLLK